MSSRKVKREDILAGDRGALARGITLIESARPADFLEADKLLASLLPDVGKAARVGISGAPGVGKSTFIEVLGGYLTGNGRRIAVLTVDPTSRRSGGSILGDKTRMERLARDPKAFIRPSPSRGTLGGVARRTRESMLLLEAAGFDVALVETVGVGQSETAVAEMVDIFVLLVAPGAGDELQGIKRGVMELADVLIVTKADGDLRDQAGRTLADYRAALHLMRPKYPGIEAYSLSVSALENRGIAEAWTAVEDYRSKLCTLGHLETLRREQARRWFRSEVQAALSDAIGANAGVDREARRMENEVMAGRLLPAGAARTLVSTLLGRLDGSNSRP